MRIVAWDLETSDLKALMGRLFCCSFQPIVEGRHVPAYTFRADRAPWRARDPIDDSKLAVAIRDELEKYHLIVSWNGKMFDAPFLNARLLRVGERPLRPQLHLDAMFYAGGVSNRIGSRKLDNVQRFLGLSEAKTPISWTDWQRAAIGDKRAFERVVIHNVQDVKVLAQAYWRLLPSVATIHR